jgi:prepilin-type N-terminal cleavage/methylation domain-containing protein
MAWLQIYLMLFLRLSNRSNLHLAGNIMQRLSSHTRLAQAGFTLVEMAIVMVIIGLITGATFVGFDMKRASEIRAVTNERGQIVSAVSAFRQKYLALPGDMRNATTYWGAAHATPATCQTTSSTDALTCNGDNNKKIGDAAATYYEIFRFWQQLANAELIKGNFTGIAGSGGTLHHVRGSNSLASYVSNLTWEVRNLDSFVGDATWFALDYDNALVIGKQTATGEPETGGGFTPEEVLGIDKKMDDGGAGTGMLVTGNWDTCTNAATNADAVTASYDLTVGTDSCSIVFLKQF